MNSEIKFETTIVHQTDEGIVSLRNTPYIEQEDGTVKIVGASKNLGLVPGDFAKVANFAPDLLPHFNKLWTPDIVKAFKTRQHMLEAKLDGKAPETLEEAKELKIREIDLDCEDTIFKGFYVEELGKHFSYDLFDQINLNSLSLMAKQNTKVPFNYGDEDDIYIYTSEEINLIVRSANKFSTYNRTYRKQLLRIIRNCKSIDEVMAIKWGVTQLEGKYLKKLKEVMAIF